MKKANPANGLALILAPVGAGTARGPTAETVT